MIRHITLKDGPRHGKSYLVPHNLTHIASNGGRYRLTKKQGLWEPQKGTRGNTEATVTTDETESDNG